MIKESIITKAFESQAGKTPDRIAVVYQNQSITYAELNRKSNQLAHLLIKKGIKAEDIVGIMVERSLEMIIGILGILKSGGAYLPLLPEYPSDRLRYISEESNMKILLTQSHLVADLAFEGEAISIDDASIYCGNETNLDIALGSDSLAYVIYTSGSTGRPKGVMIEHRNVIAFMSSVWKSSYEKYGEHQNIALFNSYVFDASVEIIFVSLLFGHTLYIVPENVRAFGRSLAHYCAENKIQILGLTPAYLSILTRTGLCSDERLNLKLVNVGGEVLRYDAVDKFLNLFNSNPPDVINLYGPAECTVTAMTYRVEKENCLSSGTVPIGLPLDFANIYILDDNLSPVPVGNTGELYIGGECVGRGYISRPDLTADRYLPNPFVPENRLYKTGDLARQLCDGNIEYIGRIDTQIKIHGYRVELEEIEQKIMEFSTPSFVIKEAVVLDKEDNHGIKYLMAYIVSEGDMDEVQLRKHLESQLPFYMLPSKFKLVKEIPVTFNGKIDRQALAIDSMILPK